jgi:hypothetical protein
MTGRSRRQRMGQALAGNVVRPLGLAFVLAMLPGCSPADNSLWPSIEPIGSRTPSAMAAPDSSSPGLLPNNPWELAGGLGLILGCGGLAVVIWKGATVQRRVEALQNSAETLARRRDSGTADLVQLSRQVSDLNKQVRSLKAELTERPLPPPAAPQPQAVQRPAPAPAAVTVPAPMPVAAAPRRAPAPSPAPPPAQAQLKAQPVSLPPLVPPPPPQAIPQAMPAPRPSAGPETAAQPRPAVVAAQHLPPAPAPASAAAPEPVLARALDVLRQATLEPPSPPATPLPATPAPATPAPARSSSASAPPAPSPSGITLQDLINAVNGRGNRQIEGISFAQLDPADFTASDGIGLPQAPRLRLVGSSGRFLMVFFDDDSWLFPAVTTLETYSHDASEVGFYCFQPAEVPSAELCRPAQLREAGGLWEVVEPGLILVPKA